jgi:hypothetical protein
MIVYQMGCANGHSFEGWFASAQACEEQADSGVLTCPTCSSGKIRKMLSAPHVHTGEAAPAADAATREKAIDALRTMVLTSTEDVGRRFAEVARRIHYKEEAARNIRGRVTADEAQELKEEGVDTLTLPPGIVPDSDEIH